MAIKITQIKPEGAQKSAPSAKDYFEEKPRGENTEDTGRIKITKIPSAETPYQRALDEAILRASAAGQTQLPPDGKKPEAPMSQSEYQKALDEAMMKRAAADQKSKERGRKSYNRTHAQEVREITGDKTKKSIAPIIKSAAAGYAADMVGAADTLLRAPSGLNYAASQERGEIEASKKNIAAYTEKLKAAKTEEERQQWQTLIDRNKRLIEINSKAAGEQVKNYQDATRGAQEKLQDTYQKLRKIASDNMEKANEGLTPVGKYLNNVGVAGAQMAADAALGGGSALGPMFLRVFGGNSQEAAEAADKPGMSAAEQLDAQNRALLYGTASGAVSIATEKISNVAAPFKKAFGGGFLDKAIDGAIAKMNGNAAGRLALSFLSEGGEEVIEDIVQPALQTIYNGQSAGQNYSELDAAEILNDFLVGGALGLIGSGVEGIHNADARLAAERAAGEAAAPTAEQQNTMPAQPTAAQEGAQGVGEGNLTPMPQERAESAQTPLQNAGETDTIGKGTFSLKEELENGRAREETRDSFLQRAADEGYGILEGDTIAFGYRPDKSVLGNETGARQIQEELRALGVNCEITDGTVLWNLNGISGTREIRQAVTVDGKNILVNRNADMPAKQVAGHEAFHLWKRLAAREAFVEAVEDNLIYTSPEFQQYQSAISQAYLGEEADLSNAAQYNKLREELLAYIGGDIHEGTNDDFLRPMFRDYDAVKVAWAGLTGAQTAQTDNTTTAGGMNHGGQEVQNYAGGAEFADTAKRGTPEAADAARALPDGAAERGERERGGRESERIPREVRNVGGEDGNALTVQKRLEASGISQFISPREANVPNGASGSNTVTIFEETDWDPELINAANWAKSKGVKKVTALLGVINIEKNGRTGKAFGVFNADTGEIFVNAGSVQRSVSETIEHETAHYLAEVARRENVRTFMRDVQSRYSSEEWGKVYDAYFDRYAALTDNYAGMSESDIELYVWEEVMGDAYAEIDQYDEKASRFNREAENALSQSGQESKNALQAEGTQGAAEQGRETAAATERRRGPPERYSVQRTQNIPYQEQIDAFYEGDLKTVGRSDDIYVTGADGSPDALGLGGKPFFVLKRNLQKITRKEGSNKNYSAHGIGEDIIRDLPDMLRDPAMVIVGDDRISVIPGRAVETAREKAAPLLIGVNPNGSVDGRSAYEIKTMYGREGFADWLGLRAKDSKIIAGNKNKATALLRNVGIKITEPVAYAADLTSAILSQSQGDVKTPTAGDENTVFADGSGWSSYSEQDSETSSIKEQIENSREKLNAMGLVARASVPTDLKSKDAAAQWAAERLKSGGYKVDRQGYGDIYFSKKDMDKGLRYADTAEEKAALAVLPQVLKRGIEIGGHANHKGRTKQTITFAAPVELNGTRGNMAVVVNKNGNHYYAHRIVLPDGTAFRFSEEEKSNAAQELSRGVTVSGSLADTTSAASENSIPKDGKHVKYSAESDEFYERLDEELADEKEIDRQERAYEKAERDGMRTDFPSISAEWKTKLERARAAATNNIKPSGFDSYDAYLDALDKQHAADRAERLRVKSRDEFKGTKALDELGVKIANSAGIYHNAEQLLANDKAAKSIQKATKRAEQRLGATRQEKRIARDIANGERSMADIPRSVKKSRVLELVDYYTAQKATKTGLLQQQRIEINDALREQARELIGTEAPEINRKGLSKLFDPSKGLVLYHRTPQRITRALFGWKQGQKINEAVFEPVYENEQERKRFINRLFDEVRTFEGADGEKSALNKDESAFAQKLKEGRTVEELVEKSGVAESIRAAAENLKNGAEMKDAAREFNLDEGSRNLTRQYADWLQTQEDYAAAENIDRTKIENAIEKYTELYDKLYAAINDFLVAHGYEPIGFIKGYAPHFQPEAENGKLESALKAIGVDLGSGVGKLPTSIAGLTKSFKPNKRYNPFFQHRRGSETDYDIVKGFETYVDYASDVLYHTDDIMRVRQMANYLRSTFAPEEMKADIDQMEAMRYAPADVKEEYLRDKKKIADDTFLSYEDLTAMMEQYTDEKYRTIEDVTEFSDLVTWLDDYANKLAGKQLFEDRLMEREVGREALNGAKKLNRMFARANVAGNFSSALNQTAQLPMIATELGQKNTWRAVGDILRGKTTGMSAFRGESDFLTEKSGIDYIQSTKGEKALKVLFSPLEKVDTLVSTIAVRGRYRMELDAGKSPKEAMKAADRWARDIMGTRSKGSVPLTFQSKNLIAQMMNMFQVEAANTFEHVTQDRLGPGFKEMAAKIGKDKAIKKLASDAIAYMLLAFLLNRLDEELYGGTPAPFDVLGMGLNAVASGNGLTSSDLLKTIMDNVTESFFGERLFDTDPDAMNDEFDGWAAAEDTWYNISNDVPYARNVAGLMGWGDQTLPMPDIVGALSKGKKALKNADSPGEFWAEVAKQLVGLAGDTLPGGRQVEKMLQGGDAVIRGGSYQGFGDSKRLQYPVNSLLEDPFEALRAAIFGKNALPESRTYWAAGGKALSAAQTRLYEDLVDSGLSRKRAYEILKRFNDATADLEADRDKNGNPIGGSKKEKIVKEINKLPLSRKQKNMLYLSKNYSEKDLDDLPWN